MRKTTILIFIIVLLMFGGAAYTLLQNPAHDFTEQECPECHALTPVKGRRETLRMTAPIDTLCNRCHQRHTDNSLSHPVGMKPVTAVPPADMPLSWDGKMTCSTCHDIHAGAPGFGVRNRSFLRRAASGADLCSACHAADPKFARNGHGHGMGTAHMRYVENFKGGRIDRVSHMCLSCHDGNLGNASDVQVRSGSWRHGAAFSPYDPQGSHPIGIRYRRAFFRRGGLRPIETLNPAIKLIDGRVGCRSCHDPFSSNPKYLVMSNAGSRLCLACHDK